MPLEPIDVRYFESPSAFRAWLAEHHGEADALWVGYWKKGTGRPSLTWPESVDEALCYGWIDGIRKRIDDEAYTIRFTPRRQGSTWSLRNLERYRALDAEGRIAPAGAAAFAKRVEEKTGTYAYEAKKPAALPAELEARIRADDRAWADWEGRPPGYKRRVSHWVLSAKRAETRERRLTKLIDDLRAGRA